MNAKGFCDKHGRRCKHKIYQWYIAGYLGNTTKDEKTGIYSIPDDIPLPYSAHSNVTKLPTLWKEMLTAAASMQSLFETMYPKLPKGVFERQLQGLVDAGLLQISRTASGDEYLELLPAGIEFMNKLNDSEKKSILDNVMKVIEAGSSLVTAFKVTWPYLQQFLH